MICKAKDCQRKATARGLCQMHYMRLRRHGDPNRADKRGPKRPAWEQSYRAMFPEVSPRTQARQLQALKLLSMLDDDVHEAAIKRASRPNGSLNVSKLLAIAIWLTEKSEE